MFLRSLGLALIFAVALAGCMPAEEPSACSEAVESLRALQLSPGPWVGTAGGKVLDVQSRDFPRGDEPLTGEDPVHRVTLGGRTTDGVTVVETVFVGRAPIVGEFVTIPLGGVMHEGMPWPVIRSSSLKTECLRTPVVQDLPSADPTCEHDADCAVQSSVCGPRGFRKGSTQAFERHVGPCSHTEQPTLGEVIPTCREGRCTFALDCTKCPDLRARYATYCVSPGPTFTNLCHSYAACDC
jgi:hypothetical protein